MALDVAETMDAIAAALETVDGLTVHAYPPASAVPPFAFVDMPQSLDFDLTAARGCDRAVFPVYVAVGTQIDRDTRDALAAYVGPFKELLDGLGANYRVQSVTFASIGMAGGSYPGAVFLVDVVA